MISGSVEHETEIFIRAIFAEPINGAIYRATMALLIGREKAEKVLARYPPICKQSGATEFITPEECKEKLCAIGKDKRVGAFSALLEI